MTVIKVEAGKEHTIKVGGKELKVTLRPNEVQYLPFIREMLGVRAFTSWVSPKTVVTLADVLEIVDAFLGIKTMPFKVELRNVLDTVDKFLKL